MSAVAAAACACAHAASDIAAGPGALATSARIDISIQVPRVMRMLLLDHPGFVQVTADDIARGSITVSGPRVDLLVNDPLGFTVRGDLASMAFSAARIVGLPVAIDVAHGGVFVRMPSMTGRPRPQPYDVRYELTLMPGVQPGAYAWPVALTLQQP